MKMFSAFLAASIILFGSLCSAQAMIDMKYEAGVKYKQADKEMNRIYKLATATRDSAGKDSLAE